MEPVTLILGALAAGALGGVGEAATSAVRDAYQGLRGLLTKKLAGRASAEVALVEHETDPVTWRDPLAQALRASGAAGDPTVIKAAQQLMALMDEAGARAGKYHVDLRGAQGVQAGDHNIQVNTFSAPPPP
jgi:hypothetical protein